MKNIFLAFGVAVAVAVSMDVLLVAQQSPHGGTNMKPQPGPNVSAAGGIVADPNDPAAMVKTDILQQRQNEVVAAPSFRTYGYGPVLNGFV